jgi:hypothetical protein
MNHSKELFEIARKALLKMHPNHNLFLNELMDRMTLFYFGNTVQDKANFIHLIGFGKRQKAREILTDMLELLNFQSDSVFLWTSPDINSPSSLSQGQEFQHTHIKFPKVVVTDFLQEYFTEIQVNHVLCPEGIRLGKFLRERDRLDISDFRYEPADARGGLVISYLDLFGSLDHIDTSMILKDLWSRSVSSFEDFRFQFIPDELDLALTEGYLKKEELIFFSKDAPRKIQLAFELIKVCEVLRDKGKEKIGIPVSFTFSAVEYFHIYFAHKRLTYRQLVQEGVFFFDPVFRQYPKMVKNLPCKPQQVEIDFKGGWKFNIKLNQG